MFAKGEYSGTSVWATWSRRATAAIDLPGSGLKDSWVGIDGVRGPAAGASLFTKSNGGDPRHDRPDHAAVVQA